jgi:hypothetical protein
MSWLTRKEWKITAVLALIVLFGLLAQMVFAGTV